jgi:hypothetical protein
MSSRDGSPAAKRAKHGSAQTVSSPAISSPAASSGDTHPVAAGAAPPPPYVPLDLASDAAAAAFVAWIQREAGAECMRGFEFGTGVLGRGAFATRRFAPGDTMISVPLRLVISEDRARTYTAAASDADFSISLHTFQ